MKEDLYPLDRTYWKHRLPLALVAQCFATPIINKQRSINWLRILGVPHV